MSFGMLMLKEKKMEQKTTTEVIDYQLFQSMQLISENNPILPGNKCEYSALYECWESGDWEAMIQAMMG
jgi:hypothetical protein